MYCICQTNEVRSNGHFVHQPVPNHWGRDLEEVTDRKWLLMKVVSLSQRLLLINYKLKGKIQTGCFFKLLISALMFKTHVDLTSVPFGTFTRPDSELDLTMVKLY